MTGDIHYWSKRVADQWDYMGDIILSDRSQERKTELINSAGEVTNRLMKEMPEEYVFSMAYVIVLKVTELHRRILDNKKLK